MDRIDRIEANLDRLVSVVDTLAASVAGHDSQIEGLIRVAETQSAETQALKEQVAALTREWQAYLRTIHPRSKGDLLAKTDSLQ